MLRQKIIGIGILCSLTMAVSASAITNDERAAIYNALIKKDYQTAIPLMQKAAAEGDANTQKNLAALYTTGVPGILPKSDKEAFKLFLQAAAKRDADALAAVGNAYMTGAMGAPKDYAKAKENLDKAIDLGNSRGKAGLAILYLKGWGVQQNLEESFKLMREAAFQKVPGAAYNLADYYRRGIGVEKNATEAASWYAKAAPGLIQQAQSYPDSGQIQCTAATLYQMGWGVPKDPKIAAKYFARGIPKLKAEANSGKTPAMLILAELKAKGWGMPKDEAAAMALIKKAADAGDGEAKWTLTQQASRGTTADAP